MFGYSRLLLVDNIVDNLPCVTLLVLFVHTVHNRLVQIVHTRNIYSHNTHLANRFETVKLFCLTHRWGNARHHPHLAGLALHRPRGGKNGHNSTTGRSENVLKSHNKPTTKRKYGCRISVIIGLVKSKNPYIIITFYKTQKCQSVMLSVGGTESPHTHNTLRAFETFYAGERFLQADGRG